VWLLGALFAGSVSAAAGCGLLDIASFNGITFNLPEKTYNVDTSDPKWSSPPAGGVPSVPCGPGGVTMDCCTLSDVSTPVTGVDCKKYPLSCEGSTCIYKFMYETGSVVDLKKEVPQLTSTSSAALKTITLKNIKLTLNNGLNMAMPPIEVFVAPMDATTVTDPRARKLATLPGHDAGYNNTEVVPVDAAGQTAFSVFAQNYKVPFKLLARAQLVLRAGQSTPAGKAVAKIGGQVEAEL
jgi:hypothetical protein